jgi:hypothetical protein
MDICPENHRLFPEPGDSAQENPKTGNCFPLSSLDTRQEAMVDHRTT